MVRLPFLFPILIALATGPVIAAGQAPCDGGLIAGTVEDSTGALIPSALVSLDSLITQRSGPDGRFRFPCVERGTHTVEAEAPNFSTAIATIKAPSTRAIELRLRPAIQVNMSVEGDLYSGSSLLSGGYGSTISGDSLQVLADDPDDLLRELQQLAALSGGNPANTIISVNGFQSDSKLPPKSAIAFIKINPDLFSAEYREPPFEGGRVEIYTKPGQKVYHGALFTTNSSSWMNARDPFSVAEAAIGKQRYGLEFSGPLTRQGTSFSLALEHRNIDNFAVVNAVALDQNAEPVDTVANIPTPQTLWLGTLRINWQLTPKQYIFSTYSANVNYLENVGVGGIALESTGYSSSQYDHAFTISHVWTISSKLMHESRLSLDWRGENDLPSSTAPQVQVAGSFTGGGASIGPQNIAEFRTEYDDDVLASVKQHLLKAGLQFFSYDEHRKLTTGFNGLYLFGGGPAPELDADNQPTGETVVISGLEQYRRALEGLPGGSSTAFTNVTGDPHVAFTQIRLGLFVQDDWTARPDLKVSLGFRYYVQNAPLLLNAAVPRAGLVWSPDKKKTWTFDAHLGLFSGQINVQDYAELQREDGKDRISSLIYAAPYGNPFAPGLTSVLAKRTLNPSFHNSTSLDGELGVDKSIFHGVSLAAKLIGVREWSDMRSVNINSPLNDQPNGPRPYNVNENILQLQNSGRALGDIEIADVSETASKHAQLYLGAVRINLRSDTDGAVFFTPQSSYTDAGEFSRRTNIPLWQAFSVLTVKLPYQLQLGANYYGAGNQPYNITTGFDNNGDGDFNDRPQFASSMQMDAVHTQYGYLTATGGQGVLRRNIGSLPWTVHLDVNLQRTFKLTADPKADHQQAITVNARSSNVLNHMNVTQEGGILGSPLFGLPYQADNGRRLEFGIRYSF